MARNGNIYVEQFLGVGIAQPVYPVHIYNATDNALALIESGDAGTALILKDNTNQVNIAQTAGAFELSNDGGVIFAVSAAGAVSFGNGAFTLPSTDGTPNQILQTNGSGVVSWVGAAAEADTLDDVTTRGNTTANDIVVGNVTIGSGGTGVDYTLTFNGQDNDGVLQWLEDELQFYFDNAVKIGNYVLPTADGTSGYVLKTNGSGVVTWQALAAEADTLDDVTTRGPSTTNAITTGNITIGSGDTGIDYTLTFNGSDNDGVLTFLEDEDVFQFGSAVKIGAYTLPSADGTSGYVLKTNGSGAVTWQEVGASSDDLDDVCERGGITDVSIQVGGLNIAGEFDFPVVDGTANQALLTDGSDTLTWQTIDHVNLANKGTKTHATIDTFVDSKAQANGLCPLDGTSKVASVYLPAIAITETFVVGSESEQLGLSAQQGDVAVRTDESKSYIHNGGVAGTMADWQELVTAESDTLQTVTNRGSSTSISIQVGGLNIAGEYDFPIVDGTDGYVLTTDGANTVTWEALPTQAGDFSNGGDTATADRTLGNNDAFALGLETNGVVRLNISATGEVSGDVFSDQQSYESAGKVLDVLTDPKLLMVWVEAPTTAPQDLSSNNHDGVYNGTMTSADQIQKGFVHALDLDGTDDYVSIADNADFSFGDGTDDSAFSVGGYIEVVDHTAVQSILSKRDDTTASEAREWDFQLDSTENLKLKLWDESVDILTERTSDSPLSIGYHFVVAAYDGSGGATAANGITLYVDGVAVASTATNDGSYVAMEDTATSVFVGARTGTAAVAGFFQGNMGMQFITKEKLSAFDVWKLYIKTRGYYNL